MLSVASQQSSRSARRRVGGKRLSERARRERTWQTVVGSCFFGRERWRQSGTPLDIETARKLFCGTDVMCVLFIICFYTGFLWCDLREWLSVVLQTYFITSAFETMIPSASFERMMPHRFAVWFEEATVVIEETGYQTYFRPFVRFGNTVLVLIFKVWWYFVFQRRAGWDSAVLYAADLGVQQCLLMRQWRRTSGQYLRKLQLRLQSSSSDRIVRDEALKVLKAVEEDRIVWGYGFLPLEDMKATAEMLTQGTPRCIDFLHDALAKALQGPDLQHELPLFKQWQQLKVTQEAVERVLALRAPCDEAGVERLIVAGARRQQVAGRLKLAPRRESMFHDLAKTVDDGETDIQAALVELDRRAKARSRKPDAAPMPVEAEASSASIVEPTPAGQAEKEPELPERVLECICCFDRSAEIVFTGCGHLAYCNGCRRKALKQASNADGLVVPAAGYARLLRRRLACPLCRKESRTAELCDFNGFVFSP